MLNEWLNHKNFVLQSWQDWRSDVKAKSAKIKRSLNGTGGGPPTKIILTPLEEELMAFLGQVVAEGLLTVVDPIDAEVSTIHYYDRKKTSCYYLF